MSAKRPTHIGRLRHRITIEQLGTTKDATGGITDSWSTFSTVWADIKPTTGKERFFAGKIEGNVTHIINIRHLAGITSAMRVSFEGRIFQIKAAIRLEERRDYMDILAEEGPAS